MKYFIAILTLVSQFSSAGSQRLIGTYTLDQMRGLKVDCQSSTVSTLTIVSESSSSCPSDLFIKRLLIEYPNGMQQHFSYTDENLSGALLTSSTFRVLPGTKCLGHVNADVTARGSSACEKSNRVKVLLTL